MNDRNEVQRLFEKWIRKLRLVPDWDIILEWVEDPAWRKTGDFKVDCSDKKAIILLNGVNPKQENLEEVLVHELLHLKLYPLDQVTESLIQTNFEEGSNGYNLAYCGFFETLEQNLGNIVFPQIFRQIGGIFRQIVSFIHFRIPP